MAKRRKKKSKKASGSFFSKILDYLTAILILAIIGGIVYYMVFKGSDDDTSDKITELYKDAKERVQESVEELSDSGIADKNISEDEVSDVEITLGDVTEEDEMMMQFENEIVENIADNAEDEDIIENIVPDDNIETDQNTVSFEKNIDFFAEKYEGLALKKGSDPDKDFATDNSHLICSILNNSAELSGKTFKGYMQMDAMRKNIHRVDRNDIKGGDLLQLKSGMLGLITHYKNKDEFKLTYASQNKGSVIITDMKTMKYYWLKSENFKGFYRFNSDILK